MTGPSVAASRRTQVLLALSLLVTAVAAVDTGLDRRWDGVALLTVAVLAQLGRVLGLRRGRRPVVLRSDLVNWLDDRSAATGEPLERVADRCVAAHRAGLMTRSGRPDGDRP